MYYLLYVSFSGVAVRCRQVQKKLNNCSVHVLSIVFLMSLVGIGDTNAEELEAYNLLSLYSAALEYDAEFQKARYERQAVDEDVVQANAQLYPSAGFNAERNFANQDRDQGSIFSPAGETDYVINRYSLSISQPIYRYGAVAQLMQAEQRAKSSDYALALAEQNLLLRLLERYLSVLAAQDATDFSTKEEEAVEQQFNLAKTRFKAQLGTEADVLDAKARYSVVRANTIAAENILQDALQSLIEITGAPISKLEPLKHLPLLNPIPDAISKWEEIAMQKNIAILQRGSNVQVAKEEIRKQQSGHHPTLDFVLSKSREETGQDNLGQENVTTTINAALQLNVPIYQGGTVTSRTRQAQKLVAAANSDLDQQRRSVAREVRAAFLGVKSALSRIDSLKQAVSAQTLVVKTRRAGFPRVYNSLDVVEAERDLYSAKRDLARANYDYILSNARLRAAVGEFNANYLAEINDWFVNPDVAATGKIDSVFN